MSYILNSKTKKYDVFVEIIPNGIKAAKKIIVGSFSNEKEAIAGGEVAQAIMNNHKEIFQLPTNEQINNWISSKLNA